MRITGLESFTVAIPFRAPILSAFGVSYPARVRTFIRLHTDAGLTGIGETGPSATDYFDREVLLTRFEKGVKPHIIGESPYDHQWLRRKLHYSPESIAVEIACWDLIAKANGVPLYRLLGGDRECEHVGVAGYCFFRAASPDGSGAVTLDSFVDHCQDIRAAYGYKTLKVKLGAHHPHDEIRVVHALRAAIGEDVELRIDPNGSWSLPTALRVLKRLEGVDLQYVEEPIRTQGPADGTTATAGLRRLRGVSQTPIAADHCYRLDLLTQIVRDDAADVVLADVFGCGGIANTVDYVRVAGAFDLGVALHSGTELCVGQAAKLHIHAALRQQVAYDGDAIYPEYVDGVLIGGKLKIEDGAMCVPQAPGLGVELDESKLAQWELTVDRHRQLDAFWEATKATLGVGVSTADALVRHY